MKIYGLMLVKNEADILEYTLRDDAKWCDKVIVIDNGSDDGTWEIVQKVAEECPNVIPFLQTREPFIEGLRGYAFDAFGGEMEEGDWWAIRMDADEFYKGNIKEFLSHVPFKYKQVHAARVDFQLTTEDDFDSFTGDFAHDKELIEYYLPGTWAEIRFLRHSKSLKWDKTKRRPEPCGLTYPKQVQVIHYQHRSPMQMQQRLEVRKIANEQNDSFHHIKTYDWKDYLVDRKDCVKDDGTGLYPTVGNRNKFNKLHTRIFKSVLTVFGYYD